MSKEMQETSITPTVDYERVGVQHGFLKLPHSHDQSAWGCIMIPITVIKNGIGPTLLLTGGNHGDEYEGVTALLKLANTQSHEFVSGRIIIVPAMNYPAVKNGTRTSPIDKGNLNRSFPGRPDGSVTEKIADYFQRYLIPLCDYALDIHSGGGTLDFLPFAAVHRLDDETQQASCVEAMRLFGAPFNMVMLEMDATSLYDTAVESQGKVFVSTELGGGGTTTPETIAIAERGVRNFLIYAGVINGDYNLLDKTVSLDMPNSNCYLLSEDDGILEFFKNLGDLVKEGELIAQVHCFEKTGVPAVPYYAKRKGVLACRHHSAKVGMGDTIAVVADIVD